MPGALIYGANQLKEQNKLYVSGSYELLEGKKEKRKKKRTISTWGCLKNIGLQELYACQPRKMLKRNE